jgi:hypothetical protein
MRVPKKGHGAGAQNGSISCGIEDPEARVSRRVSRARRSPSAHPAREMWTLRRRGGGEREGEVEKRVKTRGKFIEWSPSRKEQSPNPPTSRMKASNRRKVSQKLVSTGTTSIEWSPAAKAGSSNLASSQHGGLGAPGVIPSPGLTQGAPPERRRDTAAWRSFSAPLP